MEGRLFLYLGTISSNHIFIIISHIVLVIAIAIILALLAKKTLKIIPHNLQNIFEAYLSGVISMGKDVLGEQNSKKYLPLIATIGIYVFLANVIGIIPGFESPTADLNFTLALALSVFIYYNFEGIRANGFFKYAKHFLGPVRWLSPLMLPIEIVSHLSRVISLSFRLFGNIKGDDLFLMVLLMLAPWIIPLPAFALLSFMALLQSFIFMMLTLVYLAGATQLEDH